MRIAKIRIKNYKCFTDTDWISLEKGINVIVGRNDVGKSAFAESIGLRFGDKPHRSNETVPMVGGGTDPNSHVQVEYDVSETELIHWFSSEVDVKFCGTHLDSARALERFYALMKCGKFRGEWYGGDRLQTGWLGDWVAQADTKILYKNLKHPVSFQPHYHGQVGNELSDYGTVIAKKVRDLTYVFKAERRNVSECQFLGATRLNPDASNLPDVLNQLISGNQPGYQRLMGHIRTVFPHIAHVTSTLIPQTNTGRIQVTSGTLESERADLAVPLSDNGTGISQVLAILYVIVTSETPQVIVIDEPQSFLHPGALRKLIEILTLYPAHQYILTTHTPTAISRADHLLLMQRNGFNTSIVELDIAKQADIQLFLSEVGVRLGDVFGADSILWVEGKTEETCFPEIIRSIAKLSLEGVQILGVVSTDEFSGKIAARVYEIYSRLSGGTSLLPPAIGFVFDKEGKTEREREDLNRRSAGKVHWLPFRMFENALIDSSLIAEVIASEDRQRCSPMTDSEVDQWLRDNAKEKKYFGNSSVPEFGTTEWYDQVDGANLLLDMFNDLTEARVPYEKVRHGLLLTKSSIVKPNERLIRLGDFLATILKSKLM